MTTRAALCLGTLHAAWMTGACGGDGSLPAGPNAGNAAPAGTVTEATLGMGGAAATSVAGRTTTDGGAGSSGSAKGAVVGSTLGTAGSAAAAAGASGRPMASAAGAASAGMTAAGSGGSSTAGAVASAAGPGGAAAATPVGQACNAADKKPAPTAFSYKFLKGYQSMAKEPTTGPAKPVIEVHSGFPEWTVYRPEPLDAETPHAILIWAEGGCLQNSTIQGHALLELASWGFVVVADGKPQDNNTGADAAAGGIRSGPAAEPMVMALDWITAENERACSPFYHKLDVTKIGTAGQSCGGMMTLLSAGDKRVTTAVVSNSGVSGDNTALFASYHAPMLFMAGGSTDFLSSSATANVNAINNVPIFYGNLDVGHGATWEETNGGEFGRVMLGWLKWKLRADSSVEKMFVGADCELCKSPSKWTVVKKMMN